MSVTLEWWLFIEALGLAGAPLAATVKIDSQYR